VKPKFFARFEDFYAWLEQHHQSQKELLVGFHKRTSGKPSITWPESVDAALCFGWIDGVRKSLGKTGYTIRFTPRRPSSNWSLVNCKKVLALARRGLMRPAGRRAFAARSEERTRTYSFEREAAAFEPAQGKSCVPTAGRTNSSVRKLPGTGARSRTGSRAPRKRRPESGDWQY
jgi:uncharacterized protein YdeI (YjbR/CyaY-like superfamily)